MRPEVHTFSSPLPSRPPQDNLMNKLTNVGKQTPQNTVSLLTSTVKMDDEDGVMKFCFRSVWEHVMG